MPACRCVPTYNEYWNDVRSILQQNLPILRPLHIIVGTYLQTEDPLHMIMKICPPVGHNRDIIQAEIQSKIVIRRPILYIHIYERFKNAKSTDAVYSVWRDESIHVNVYAHCKDVVLLIRDSMNSCAHCVSDDVEGNIIFVAMPFECKCENQFQNLVPLILRQYKGCWPAGAPNIH